MGLPSTWEDIEEKRTELLHLMEGVRDHSSAFRSEPLEAMLAVCAQLLDRVDVIQKYLQLPGAALAVELDLARRRAEELQAHVDRLARTNETLNARLASAQSAHEQAMKDCVAENQQLRSRLKTGERARLAKATKANIKKKEEKRITKALFRGVPKKIRTKTPR